MPHREATRLPGAPSYVQGLINLRGTIVTVLDLGVRLGATRERVPEGSIMLVAMPGNARLVGVAVEEVMDVRVVGTSEDDVIADSAGNDAAGRSSSSTSTHSSGRSCSPRRFLESYRSYL